MPAKRAQSSAPSIETFRFQDRTYEIDPQRGKVYRKFVEIETSKAAEIFSVWRSGRARV